MVDTNLRREEVLRLRKENYSYSQISKILGMNKFTVAYYARKKTNEDCIKELMKRQTEQQEYEQIVCENAAEATSMNNLCVLLNKRPTNTNYALLKRILEKHNVDTSHFKSMDLPIPTKRKLTFEEKFCYRKDKITGSLTKLKGDLLKLGIKEHKCEKCGRTEWDNLPIPLQLHHINGDRQDNRVENLQLLCPNCHAQTDNYSGKNILKNHKIYNCRYCGKEFHRGEGSSISSMYYCSAECRDKMNGRRNQYVKNIFRDENPTKRPTKEQLIKDYIELKHWTHIGEKYNVTDSAIRKWFKSFGLPIHIKELKKYIKEINEE